MQDALRRLAIGLYGLWLVAVVLLVLGRYTGVPTFPGVRAGVVLGATVFVAIGAGKLLGDGYRRLVG